MPASELALCRSFAVAAFRHGFRHYGPDILSNRTIPTRRSPKCLRYSSWLDLFVLSLSLTTNGGCLQSVHDDCRKFIHHCKCIRSDFRRSRFGSPTVYAVAARSKWTSALPTEHPMTSHSDSQFQLRKPLHLLRYDDDPIHQKTALILQKTSYAQSLISPPNQLHRRDTSSWPPNKLQRRFHSTTNASSIDLSKLRSDASFEELWRHYRTHRISMNRLRQLRRDNFHDILTSARKHVDSKSAVPLCPSDFPPEHQTDPLLTMFGVRTKAKTPAWYRQVLALLWTDMNKLCIQPPFIFWSTMLHYLGPQKPTDVVRLINVAAQNNGLTDNLCASSIAMISKHTGGDGQLESAREVLKIAEKKLIGKLEKTVGALIDACVRCGDLELPLELLKVHTDRRALNSVLRLWSKGADLRSVCAVIPVMDPAETKRNADFMPNYAKQLPLPEILLRSVEAWMRDSKNGRETRDGEVDSFAYDTMLEALVSRGLLFAALEFFVKIPTVVGRVRKVGRSVYSYNILIRGLCEAHRPGEACQLLHAMSNDDLEPDSVSYNTIMGYFSRRSREVVMRDAARGKDRKRVGNEVVENARKVVGLFGEMRDRGVSVTGYTLDAVVSAIAMAKMRERAVGMFASVVGGHGGEGMTDQSYRVILTNLFESFLADGNVNGAMRLFEMWVGRLDDRGKPGFVQPDVTMYTALIGGCAAHSEFGLVKRLVLHMRGRGVKADRVFFGTLVKAYGGAGDVEGVKTIVRLMRRAGEGGGVETFGAALDVLTRMGMFEQAEKLRKMMMEGEDDYQDAWMQWVSTVGQPDLRLVTKSIRPLGADDLDDLIVADADEGRSTATLPPFHPNLIVISILCRTALRLGEFDKALLHYEWLQSLSTNARQLKNAEVAFLAKGVDQGGPHPDYAFYGMMLHGFANVHGQTETVLRIWKDMRRDLIGSGGHKMIEYGDVNPEMDAKTLGLTMERMSRFKAQDYGVVIRCLGMRKGVGDAERIMSVVGEAKRDGVEVRSKHKKYVDWARGSLKRW
ncbi:hypothetical protein BJ742DRAFT_859171 [Cladochytrium replicatum]|nr:hypothetical protein BJ742DRAFT_859171 [Cladochytrium replicatum]